MSTIEKFTHTIHEYERSKENKEIYRCVHPLCTHYQRRAYLIGKAATCCKCKTIFNLSIYQLRNKKPVCDYCSKSPKSAEMRLARQIANSLIKEQDDLPDDIKKALIDATLE